MYFRGYLLPRIDRFGIGAPLLGAILFALYHLWTPWQGPMRIVGFFPVVYVVWRWRNIGIAIAVHIAANLTATIPMALSFLKG